MEEQYISLFGGVKIPHHVTVETITELKGLYDRLGRMTAGGAGGTALWGQVYPQGNRLLFATAAPIPTLLDISEVEQPEKGQEISIIKEMSNRPEEKAHARSLRDYLSSTACEGKKFILPAFTLNWGTGLFPDSPKVRVLVLAVDGGVDARTYVAILIIPRGARLKVTDGGHRHNQIVILLSPDKGANEEEKDLLRANAVSVTVVFESNRMQAHQDFADCGKSKAISSALLTAYDQRDQVNIAAVKLVESLQFLRYYTNATASTVNLSGRSKQAWSLSAWRNFIGHVRGEDVPAGSEIAIKMARAPEFLAACIEHIPQLAGLEALRLVKGATNYASPADLRNTRGGSILMRSVGISLLAQAYTWALANRYNFDAVAKGLGTIDWHVLTIPKSELKTDAANATQQYSDAVMNAAVPLWRSLLVIGDLKFRLAATKDHAEKAFAMVRDQIEAEWRAAGVDPTLAEAA